MDREKLTDLVRSAQQGDSNAVSGLYEATYQDIYYFILKNVSGDTQLAEDLTQDTYMEILDSIGKLQEPGAFTAWSHQIAYHKCTAYFRKRHELLADENEDGQTIFDTIEEDRAEFIPDEALDQEDLKKTLLAMLQELPQEQRSAIMLRYYKELSVKEIADIQGVSENTVKSRLNYGRKAVKQAVESYEKKSGIKLHSVAILPLLLWLFRQQAISAGVSITTKTATATIGAGAASSGGATAAGTVAKTAGKFAAKKLIAGITAAAVVTGGITAGILLNQDDGPHREERSMTWVGYGDCGKSRFREDRAELVLEVFEEDEIKGTFTCSGLYETFLETNFEGTGSEVDDDTIVYEITMDVPYKTYFGEEHYDFQLYYEKETEMFWIDNWYRVNLYRTDRIEKVVYSEAEMWTGYGEDTLTCGTCLSNHHLYEIYIERLTNTEIVGHLTVSKDGVVSHSTDFTGRGYEKDGSVRYEIELKTPRTVEYILEATQQYFWMQYSVKDDVLKCHFMDGGYYDFEVSRQPQS